MTFLSRVRLGSSPPIIRDLWWDTACSAASGENRCRTRRGQRDDLWNA